MYLLQITKVVGRIIFGLTLIGVMIIAYKLSTRVSLDREAKSLSQVIRSMEGELNIQDLDTKKPDFEPAEGSLVSFRGIVIQKGVFDGSCIIAQVKAPYREFKCFTHLIDGFELYEEIEIIGKVKVMSDGAIVFNEKIVLVIGKITKFPHQPDIEPPKLSNIPQQRLGLLS